MDYDAPPIAIVAPSTITAGVEDSPAPVHMPVYVKPTTPCVAQGPGEIVVCAQRPEKFRLRPEPERFEQEQGLPRMQFKTGETTLVGGELEATGVGGHPSNRVMVTGKLKF